MNNVWCHRILTAAVFVALVALPASAADMSTFDTWFWTKIGAGVIGLAVMVGGIMLMFNGHGWWGLAGMAMGAIIASNYETIASQLGG